VQFGDIALARILGEFHARIQIRHHLHVRNLGDDGPDFVDGLELGHIALPRIHLRCDGHVAELREPPAHIFDVLMHAENLLHHQHHGEWPPFVRHGAVGRDLLVRYRYFDLTGGQP
jgi:hypothetical protein